MPDEITDDIQTSGTVTVGGSTTSEIDTAGDVDWFAVTLVAGEALPDRPGGRGHRGRDPGGPVSAGDLRLERHPHKLDRRRQQGRGRQQPRVFQATADGTYYVAAGAEGTGTGTYKLSVVRDDFADDTETRGSLTLGVNKRGDIETAGDEDWFKVTLEAGKNYLIALNGSLSGQRHPCRPVSARGLRLGRRPPARHADRRWRLWRATVKWNSRRRRTATTTWQPAPTEAGQAPTRCR